MARPQQQNNQDTCAPPSAMASGGRSPPPLDTQRTALTHQEAGQWDFIQDHELSNSATSLRGLRTSDAIDSNVSRRPAAQPPTRGRSGVMT